MSLAPADRDLIERIRARVPGIDLHREVPPPPPTPPFDLASRPGVETHLGFVLPDILVQIYHQIGNGGFGPGYGLMGLSGDGFTDDLGHTADALYASFRSDVSDDDPFEWPEGLLPVCHFGCAIYHCIEADSEEIIIWDPNLWDGESSVATALFPTGLRVNEWLARWSTGEPLPEVQDASGSLSLKPKALSDRNQQRDQ